MKIIGLTGGIASGKSTVATLLREMEIPVIDADDIAHQIVAPGEPAYQEIVQTFGPHILSADGTIDRKRLGSLVFAQEEQRKKLNAITHPRVAQRFAELSQQLAEEGHSLLVYEVPLLFETGLHHSLDAVILVAASEEQQLQRLQERNQLSPEAARARLQAQMPLAQKRALADYVIDNSNSLEELRQQVHQIWNSVSATLKMKA